MSGALWTLDEQLGRRLRARRKHIGATMTDIAKAIGTVQQQVHKYELGQSQLCVTRLFQFGGALGISVADLLSGLEVSEPVAMVAGTKYRRQLSAFKRAEAKAGTKAKAGKTKTLYRAARPVLRDVIKRAELPQLAINLQRSDELLANGHTAERAAEILRSEMAWQL